MAYADPAELSLEERNQITADYMATFSTAEGRRVLGHMLIELGFFDTCETEEEYVRRNYAIHILRILNAISGETIPAWIDRIISMTHVISKGEQHGRRKRNAGVDGSTSGRPEE